MTSTEAAQLVIQAGAMGKKSEVFVLDMGESVKIRDLVLKMIKLSGLSIKDDKNPDGDIEIKITGLRPGEKLYEELLIGKNPKKTSHPKIQKISDPYISYELLELELNNLKNLLDKNRTKDVKDLLEKLVKSYETNSNIIDHVYIEELVKNKHDKNQLITKDYNNNIIKIK
jgi:FlaA1/EpsC-like NDP-sugar epimerase